MAEQAEPEQPETPAQQPAEVPPQAETAPTAQEIESEGAPIQPPESKPSKSNLVNLEKKVSKQQSRVRLVEPSNEAEKPQEGEAEPEQSDTRRKSGGEVARKLSTSERRKSEIEETERRKSGEFARRKSREASVTSIGKRSESQRLGSVTSKEILMRRQSDRPSKARAAVGSIISIRRASGYGEYVGGVRTAKYMNTYKLDSDNPFEVEKVEKILKSVLTEALENLTYDPDKCPKQAKWACSAIRARVKEKDYDRYKLVCMVTIGEKRYQDMCSIVRFLWDIERDKYALFVHENMHVFAAAMCFGIYYE